MKFEKDSVVKIAHLARLKLNEQELEHFAKQLGGVLEYIDVLKRVDTSGVEPMTHALELTTPLRDDVAASSPGPEAMLASAPDKLYDNYKVPQVIGGSP